MMGNGWGSGMGWMWLLWPLAIVAVVAVVALLVRSGDERTRASGPADPVPPPADEPPTSGRASEARRILDERYARGEIDEEDYRTRRRRLAEPDD